MPERESSLPVRTSLWPLALLGILFVVSLFRSRSNTPNKQSIKSIQEQDDTDRDGNIRKNEDDITSKSIAALEIPPTNSKKKNPSKRRNKINRLSNAGSFWIGLITLIALVAYTAIARNQWQEQIRATNESTRAVQTSRSQLEMTERPWLKVSFGIQKPGITFQDGGMQLNITPNIVNIGHSVATGVVSPMKVLLADDADTMFKEPLRQQKELCDKLAKQPVVHGPENKGITIFPNDGDASWGYGLSLSKAEVDAAKDGRIGINGAKLDGPKILVPIVYGCVDYVYDTSDRHHQTQFIFQIQQVNKSTIPHRVPMIAIRANQPVSESDVVIEKYPFGGFYAY